MNTAWRIFVIDLISLPLGFLEQWQSVQLGLDCTIRLILEDGRGGAIVGPCSIRAPKVSWCRRGILRILIPGLRLLGLREVVEWSVAHIDPIEVLPADHRQLTWVPAISRKCERIGTIVVSGIRGVTQDL